jgi:rhomboid protease GluP
MSQYSEFDSPNPIQPPNPSFPLPLSKPFFTYILLAAIIIIWLLMTFMGGSTNPQVLVRFGANYGELILQGEIWRLFTSMFLHIGPLHLAFNAYALFIFGMEMERLYGPDRFIVIYILSGLFGNLVSFFSRGADMFSAGASGAVFGIIGMNLIFFLLHREAFGQFGRQRVMNTLVVIGINLFFGLTIPAIDNLAHVGGLIAGFALGYGLAPRYKIVNEYTSAPQVVDTVSLLNRWWVPMLGALLLAGGLVVSLWLRQS